MDLHAIRPAVVLQRELPFAPTINPKDAAEGDVDDPEHPVAVETGALQEALDFDSAPVRLGPGVASFPAEAFRQRRKQLRF
jgi:hypothetical protein